MGKVKERWEDIVGYEGSYQVSNHGRVKSLPRVVWRKDGTPNPINGKLLKKSINKSGYHTVVLFKEGTFRERMVGRLVLEAFRGPAPKGMVCRRGTDGKLDDSLTNLSWGQPGE